MKKILLTFIPLLLVLAARAQVSDPTSNDENQVFTAVEQEPEYPGGPGDFYKFLEKNLRYPALARQNEIQGRVIVQMTVEKDGSLSDVRVVRGIGGGCDEEAVRLIKLSAPWKPGIQNGRPVRVQYMKPISFSLDDAGSTDNSTTTDVVIDEPVNNDSSGKIFTAVEQVPQFPGGMEAFYKFLDANIHYPQDARDEKKEGRVIVQFVVEKDGTLTDIKIVRGVFPSIDAEALRIIKSSPKWKPGLQNGRMVRVQYSVPIRFSLGGE